MNSLLVVFLLVNSIGSSPKEVYANSSEFLFGEWEVAFMSAESSIERITFFPNRIINIESKNKKLVQYYQLAPENNRIIEIKTGFGSPTPLARFRINSVKTGQMILTYQSSKTNTDLILKRKNKIQSGFQLLQ